MILFLRDFQIVLKENHVEDKWIEQIEGLITELSQIKSQCLDENDFNGLWFVLESTLKL